MPDAPTNLEVLLIAPGEVTLQFTGADLVNHYDIYRSTDETLVGDKINISPVPQVASPFTVTYVDNVVNSVVPPTAPGIYYYKAVAVDATGAISLPSNEARASVGLPQDITPKQATIIAVEERGNP